MTNRFTVRGTSRLRGRLRVPGDKSISHRALLFAAVAEGRSTLRGLATGVDVHRTRMLVEALGIRVRETNAGELRVQGMGWDGLREPLGVADCGNSGTTARIALGHLAGQSFHTVLSGDKSLSRRPMLRVVAPLRSMGAHIDGRHGGEHLPLAVRGGRLHGLDHRLEVASAQVKTALVLAGLQADGPSTISEPGQSRDHTERMLASLDVPVHAHGSVVHVEPAVIPPLDIDVPGDPSSSAFFLVAAIVLADSEVVVEDVAVNPTRIGFVEVLRRMGGDIDIETTGESCGEPVGTITARSSELTGTLIGGDEVPAVIDEIPALAVAAAFADGVTEIRDAEELRVKETDRIGAIEQELSQMGIGVEARRDGLVIRGGRPLPGKFKSHGDHRIAMAAAVAAAACQGESVIQGWGAVDSSYPEFGEHLEAVTEPTP